MDYKGIDYLRTKLAYKKRRVDLRYNYYEMKRHIPDISLATPPEFRNLSHCLGWCAKAVDSLADRISFSEFRNDAFGLNEVYRLNNPDVIFSSAVLSALISSCSFIYISADEDGLPRMQVLDGGNATGIMDEQTAMLTEGYAVLKRGENDEVLKEAYFTAEGTFFYEGGRLTQSQSNPAPYPLLVPVIYRPDAKRPFGHSRISRACMQLTDDAARIMRRTEVTAEFYSFPQKWVTGLSQEAEPMEKWKSAMSAMLTFEKDDDGGSPSVGQFSAASMQPHIDHFRMIASAFAGETGLTLDDLGFLQANPSSAEAIKASHETLRLQARRAQETFGTGFLNAGYLASCLRDGQSYQRRQVYLTQPVWRPIFEPDASMLSAIGDGIGKLQQAVPDLVTADLVRELTGIG